ncbi:uncharacterized protein LOC121398827 [Xenopus laevis]|uniref:Uncharacterized protein LOC121398827 n=1 Tax=Xenopus laevis TaxID=8355 RepID=A0A8J1LXJ9_XENLA|nr:uncharacterized protein LOC121398827 [Xenopus laevis]
MFREMAPARDGYGFGGWEREYDFYGGHDEQAYANNMQFFPISRQWVRGGRSSQWEDYRHNGNGMPSFYFRNREEEESWRQWRKEKEMRMEEAGPSQRHRSGTGQAAQKEVAVSQEVRAAGGVRDASVAGGTTPCRIVIIGHSFVYWASRHAAGQEWGLPEENMKTAWLGWRGMRWEQLKGRLVSTLRQCEFVDLLVIHAGGNDLTVGKTPALIEAMRKDMEEVIGNPKVGKIAWSDIIQRGEWRGAIDPKGVEKARKKVNRAMHKIMYSSGNGIIRHENIKYKQKGLYRYDRVHLSREGLDLFLKNIGNFVEEWWRSRAR